MEDFPLLRLISYFPVISKYSIDIPFETHEKEARLVLILLRVDNTIAFCRCRGGVRPHTGLR